jgi:hypothetical protein
MYNGEMPIREVQFHVYNSILKDDGWRSGGSSSLSLL